MSKFFLGKKSLDTLQGVHPDLVAVVKRAIELTEVDFTVLEGLRSHERQAKLVASGASKTLNSRHLTGHAVDLGAIVDFDGDGRTELRWDWPLYHKIAEAMRAASIEKKIPIRWGGTWGLLSDLQVPITDAVLSRSFSDGPHFELPWASYPLKGN
jgi:peptidoglycan L-alanyl-D-glutamate endopeptidase CwlK